MKMETQIQPVNGELNSFECVLMSSNLPFLYTTRRHVIA